jgi:hypothetical protein
MPRGLVLLKHLVHSRLTLECPGDGLLHRLVIVLIDLLVVLGLPVDEHTHQDAEVVGLGLGDDAFADRVHHRARHRRLSRPEHLHRLLGALDGHLVEEQRVGLGRKVRRHDGQQSGEAILVVGQRAGKCRAGRPGLRPDDQVDVGDLVAIADE